MEIFDQSVVGVFVQVQQKVAVVTLASALLRENHNATCDDIDVLLGAYNLKDEEERSREQFEVRRFEVHPKYRPGEYSFDIAVLFFAKTPTQNMEIRRCILPPERPSSQSACHIASWGYEKEDRSLNDRKLIKTIGVKISTGHPMASGERGHLLYASRTQGGSLVELQDVGAPLLCRDMIFYNVFAGIVHIPASPHEYHEIAITSVYDNGDWLRHTILLG
ncbi:unnamed protein product [Soboliphyme baturini]|uniref:Peptidase S1 domain-containing protein n=1 Tax=Soboliphyme baturini TaxID=241478 RepID=A0A183I939_9BILA|nr:unnamed protein product [Soboliphyme baturini]